MWRKLAILPAAQADELRRFLNVASIDSFETPEGAGGPVGAPDALYPETERTVWVDDSDFVRAQTLTIDLLKEMRARAEPTKCQACGYDLQAHHGEGQCPECAYPFFLPFDRNATRVCHYCGEKVPADFEVCWNCCKAMETGMG